MTTTPGADELETRDRLLALGVSYAPTADDAPAGEPGEEGHLENAAPGAEEAASTVPAPRRGAPRLPDWWNARKPDLPVEAPEDLGEPESAEEPEELERPSSSPDRADYRTRMREWLEAKRVPAAPKDTDPEDEGDDEDDEDTGEEDSGDEDGDGPREGGPVRKTASGKGRSFVARRRPRFAAPGVPHTMKAAKDRRSLLEIIRSTPDHVVWLLYTGSALAVGFWRGGPQWVTDGVDFLVTEHPSLTDTYSLTCYGLAAGVLFLDWRARGWVLPLAWAARIPSACLVVGVLMYGDPTPIIERF